MPRPQWEEVAAPADDNASTSSSSSAIDAWIIVIIVLMSLAVIVAALLVVVWYKRVHRSGSIGVPTPTRVSPPRVSPSDSVVTIDYNRPTSRTAHKSPSFHCCFLVFVFMQLFGYV